MSLDYQVPRAGEPAEPADETKVEAAVHKWERWSGFPLAVLAVAYLAIYAHGVLSDLGPTVVFQEVVITDIIWLIFVFDFIIRFYISREKLTFLKRNVVEVVSLFLPLFRAFVIFRVVVVIGFLARAAQGLRGRINLYLFVALPLFVFTGALGVYDAEHDVVGAKITDFGDAIWWAIVTVTTIGYGEYYPISMITVSLGSWFLSRLNTEFTMGAKKDAKK